MLLLVRSRRLGRPRQDARNRTRSDKRGATYTIDGLTITHGLLAVDARTLLIVDEASKVDTGRWAHLAALVEDRDSRVLAVGDEGELQAIELAGLFPELCRAAPTATLREVRRHRDPANSAREHPWLGRYRAVLVATERRATAPRRSGSRSGSPAERLGAGRGSR